MGTRQLIEQIVPSDWDSAMPQDAGANSGFPRVRWLQQVVDTFNRPVMNRVTATTSATAVVLNGAVQSTGIGCGPITPKRYAELTIKARITFNISAAGTLYVYVYRTKGAIPASGAAPNAGDVIVGGDAFAGPATVAGQNTCASLSVLDTGLSESQAYRYYIAFKGTNALTGNLVNSSQLLVMERS